MPGRTRKNILAVIIGEKSIELALHQSGRETIIANMAYPAGFQWEKPGNFSQLLKALLREKGITERRAIIGLPSRWLLAKPIPLPPTNTTSAVGILRLAIEREYQSDAKDWVFDYAGEPSPKERSTVLLTATPRARLAMIVGVMKDAGLIVEVVSSTMIELMGLSKPGLVLYVTPEGAEIGVNTARGPVLIDRIISALAQPSAIVGEVRRLLSAAGTSIDSLGGLSVYSSGEIKSDDLRNVSEKLGLVNHTGACLSAVESVSNTPLENIGVNFQESKLAEEPARWLTRPRAGVLAAATILTVIILYLVGDWYNEKLAVDDLKDNLAAMRAEIGSAKANVEKMTYARKWFDTRPAILTCAREVTLAFPTSGQAWTTSLTVKDDLTGTLSGRAQTEKNALELLDRMRGSNRFADVKLVYLRQADRTSKIVAFALTFKYAGKE